MRKPVYRSVPLYLLMNTYVTVTTDHKLKGVLTASLFTAWLCCVDIPRPLVRRDA